MTGRITKRMNLDGVTLSPSPLLLSPLPSRCRSHTGEHNPTSDPHTAKRCKPLHHSANTQHKPQAPLTPSNWSALYRGRGSPVMSWILLKPWGVFIGAGQPLQHGEVRDTNLAWVRPVAQTMCISLGTYCTWQLGLLAILQAHAEIYHYRFYMISDR